MGMPMKQDLLLDDYLFRLEGLFEVALPDARGIVARFHEEMRRGLAGEESSLPMLPSFVRRPSGTERGRFLAVDLGGTNVRVLAVALDGKGGARTEAASRFPVPGEVMRGDGAALFDFVARCVASFLREHVSPDPGRLDLAFAFSFPVAQSSVAAGELLAWTKGYAATGVVGRDVAALLAGALSREKLDAVRVAALANDTVGTLAAGSYADPECDMGVILGTGTNACYPEKAGRIAKCPGLDPNCEMIVNMEWGSFDKLEVNAYDRAVDRASLNPGRQRLEKTVSGMYLGELARRIFLEMSTLGFLPRGLDRSPLSRAYVLTAEHLAKTEEGGDVFPDFGLAGLEGHESRAAAEVCRIVSRRAARIAGTAIAAVLSWMDSGLQRGHAVAVDGSLFEKYPGFAENVTGAMAGIFGARSGRVRLEPARDGSGIGAAVIAAVAASGSGRGGRVP
jgi:hexokinase